jgi:hypothetical protein
MRGASLGMASREHRQWQIGAVVSAAGSAGRRAWIRARNAAPSRNEDDGSEGAENLSAARNYGELSRRDCATTVTGRRLLRWFVCLSINDEAAMLRGCRVLFERLLQLFRRRRVALVIDCVAKRPAESNGEHDEPGRWQTSARQAKQDCSQQRVHRSQLNKSSEITFPATRRRT